VTISSASEENKNASNPKVTFTKNNDYLYKMDTERKYHKNDDNNLLNNSREKRTHDILQKESVSKTILHSREQLIDITKNEKASSQQNKIGEFVNAPMSCSSCFLGKVHICREDDSLDEEELAEY